METKWIDIKDYYGLYQINKNGEVKSLNRLVRHRSGFRTIPERILTTNIYRDGYARTTLCKYGIEKQILIHRLMAIAFIPNTKNKPFINHIDGNKQNNALENLEWCTSSENAIHSYKNGLSKAPWLGKFGKENKDSKPIKQYTKDGEFIKLFNGIAEASRITGISKSHISDVCRGEKPFAKNFKWKFAS